MDWDPTILDCELEDGEEWFDTMQDLPELDPDPLFDEFGDYRHIQNVAKAIVDSNLIDNCVIKDYNHMLQLYNQNVMPSKIDYESYRPKLAWLPVDVIKHTFERTTQFYRMPMGTNLKKRYKSPFPACNVHRRDEPVATDTVCSDTPAIDSGITAAQFFVGT